MTLKDIDFMNYEGKIHLEETLTVQLRETLRKDTQFLKQLNLIDYSLLLVRVLWRKPPADQKFWTKLQRIKHLSN